MGEVSVRPATVDDVAGLRALGEAVVPATYGPIDRAYAEFSLERWWSVDGMRDSLQTVPHWVGVDPDGRVVGVANLGRSEQREVMWKLYVLPERQGAGVGSRLLDTVVEHVEATELWLEHLDGNHAAAAFYRSKGFVEAGREPIPPYPDLVWMRKDLS